MSSFLDHVKSCQAVCEGYLADYLKPEKNLCAPLNDFARGKRNQITLCLLSMSQELEAFVERPHRFPSANDHAALRAEFFVIAIGETALKNASDEDEVEPVSLEEDTFERLWSNIVNRIETSAYSKQTGFNNFAAYARGCEAGSREFRDAILPGIIRKYQSALGESPPERQRTYRM